MLFDAGFRILEVPLNRRGALQCIVNLTAIAPADALIGGGTMLSRADVDTVRAAGGRLMVSPNCNPSVISHAVVDLIHGCQLLLRSALISSET